MIDQDDLIGDDCALVELANEKYLFCLDNLIENTHFKTDYFSPYDIAWKAIAVNISDIAAMAGVPLMALIGLNLREDLEDKENWVRKFYSGIKDCAAEFGGVKIIGGDLCKSKSEISVSVTLIGKANSKGVLLRTGAKAGDKVCVTGSFGNSAKFLQNTDDKTYAEAQLRPKPRLKEAQKIWNNNSRGALMDTSDGLAQALIELSERNQLDIELDSGAIPRNKDVELSLALYGGEDYELIGCFEEVPEAFTLIGHCKKPDIEPKVILKPEAKILTKNEIYKHF